MKSKRVTKPKDALSQQLVKALAGYASIEAALRKLRGHPGFEKLGRATLFRWRDNRPGHRFNIARAIDILAGKKSARTLDRVRHESHQRQLEKMLELAMQLSREAKAALTRCRAAQGDKKKRA